MDRKHVMLMIYCCEGVQKSLRGKGVETCWTGWSHSSLNFLKKREKAEKDTQGIV